MQDREAIRLLLTGGETGGHLYPALAVAEALAGTVPGSAIVYVGAAGRIDMAKAIGAHFTTHALCMRPYDRVDPLGNAVLPWRLLCSFGQAFCILRRYRPHAVMGLGAFPSVPVVLAAWMVRIPTLLLEPNAQPGMANRLLARVARWICVSQPGMEDFFPRDKIVTTGTPVRSGLLREASDRQRCCALFGIQPGARTVLIAGGSIGSITINNMVLENLDFFAGGIGHLLWLTGEREEQRIRTSLGDCLPKNCTILPYTDQMGCAYGAADLVVSSAGATSLAELALLGKPAIIIPDPDVTENHQRNNARDLHEKEACVLVGAGTPTRQMALTIIELLNDRSKLDMLRKKVRQCAKPQAARLVVGQILELAGRTDIPS